MIGDILKIPFEELKAGYSFDAGDGVYTCLICGKKFESGEVFSLEGRFYEASKAIRFHVGKEHGGMFNILSSYDKKYTGLTDNQRELLQMICEGFPDNEIAKKTGVSAATVRHQRFVFREKAKQTKLYLAMFELAEAGASGGRGKSTNDVLADIHTGARMVDDRYITTKTEEDKIIASAFKSLEPLKLKVFSPREKKKIVILKKICEQFKKGVKYSEKEVNSILKPIYEDYATIRRYLIEYGFMNRTKDCKEYWLE